MELTDYIEKYNINLVDNWGTDVYKYDDTYYTFPCGGLSYYVSINMTDGTRPAGRSCHPNGPGTSTWPPAPP